MKVLQRSCMDCSFCVKLPFYVVLFNTLALLHAITSPDSARLWCYSFEIASKKDLT